MARRELKALLQTGAKPDEHAWQPAFYDAGSEVDRSRLEVLLQAHPDLTIVDTIASQLRDLARTDNRKKEIETERLSATVDQLLGGRSLETYGVWVHYPWRRTLVHVLPPAEFRRLRLNRNLHKVTEAEQRALAGARIVVVGLSVGRSALLDLVQEGVGGTFVIADFDRLDVSNLNRLRGSVCDVGTNKAVLAAREVYEQDPFVHVELYSNGVTDDNLARILSGDTSLLIEECDDLSMKVRLRERARALRIPVLMETSDRGMLDVERFDLDPHRPILHGLLPGVDAAALKGLSNKERVPFALAVLDPSRLSPRMAGTLAEIEETAYTWPQLASGVALGGALVCDTARRLLLGTFTASGRYYVDFEALVAAGREVSLPEATSLTIEVASPARAERQLPAPERDMRDDPQRAIAYLVAHAQWAPSGGNNQPWRFRASRKREGKGGELVLECLVDRARAESFLDFDGRGYRIALGAAVENIAIAAPSIGLRASVTEADAQGAAVARIVLSPCEFQDSPLRRHVAERVTHRHVIAQPPLDRDKAQGLVWRAQALGLRMNVVAESARLAAWGHTLGEVDRLRGLIRPYHDELFSELRWSPQEVLRTRTGIDVHSLELSAADAAGIRVLERSAVADFLRQESLGGALSSTARKAVAGCAGLGLVSAPDDVSFFEGGRRLQRLWLEATALGVAFQPWAPVLGMMPRAQASAGLSADECRAIAGQVQQLLQLWHLPRQHYPLFLFRMLDSPPAPTSRSLRLGIEEVLVFV